VDRYAYSGVAYSAAKQVGLYSCGHLEVGEPKEVVAQFISTLIRVSVAWAAAAYVCSVGRALLQLVLLVAPAGT
jgi:hypothetical protein